MLDSHRGNILQDLKVVFLLVQENVFFVNFDNAVCMYGTSGRLMSLLSSLKFCVIEHAWTRKIGISLILANSQMFFDNVLYPDFARLFKGGGLSASHLSP